jgi:hypothetical protein
MCCGELCAVTCARWCASEPVHLSHLSNLWLCGLRDLVHFSVRLSLHIAIPCGPSPQTDISSKIYFPESRLTKNTIHQNQICKRVTFPSITFLRFTFSHIVFSTNLSEYFHYHLTRFLLDQRWYLLPHQIHLIHKSLMSSTLNQKAADLFGNACICLCFF